MAISYRDLLGCGLGGDRTWGYDPQLAQGCCKAKCPEPVYVVPSPFQAPATATPAPGGTMKGGGFMGYLRGFGAVPPTGNGAGENFTVDPSVVPQGQGGVFSMEELRFLPQAQVTPQDQLAAAQGRRGRVSTRVPPGSGSLPFEIEKHAQPRTGPTQHFEFIELGLVGERF